MKLLNSASYASINRGYYYAIGDNVKYVEKINDTSYFGLVKGNKKEPYKVHIDIEHIRQSSCDCPFTEGNRKICKHMIALYFTAFPNDLKSYEAEVIEEEKLAESIRIEQEMKFYRFIYKLKKQELRYILIELLEHGPDWQFDQFM